MHAEKNEVNLEPLFKWGKEFELLDGNGNTAATLYMRLVGDSDLNKARVFALRRSAEKRRSLRNTNSDDRVAYIVEEGELDRDRLMAMNILFASKNLARKAVKEVIVPLPKEPKGDADLEAMEKFQKQVDDYQEKRDKMLREYINKEIVKYEKVLESKNDKELYDSYVRSMTDELCEEEMLTSFKEMCTYFGTFKDSNYSERFFRDFEEFINLPVYLKEQFMSAYESLELNTEDLKKLQEATR